MSDSDTPSVIYAAPGKNVKGTVIKLLYKGPAVSGVLIDTKPNKTQETQYPSMMSVFATNDTMRTALSKLEPGQHVTIKTVKTKRDGVIQVVE